METTNFERNKKIAQELKGNYQFISPYHLTSTKMLPFNVLGTVSFNQDYPIEVYTVEYRGWTKIDHYGNYNIETIKEFIESGFIKKID
jgi:hypothetical protein